MEKFINRRDKQASKGDAQPHKQPWHATKRVRMGAAIAGGAIAIVLAIGLSLQMAANGTIKDTKAAKAQTTKNVQSLQSSYAKTPLQQRPVKLQNVADGISTVDCKSLSRLPWFAEAKKDCMAFAQKSEVLKAEITQLAEIATYDAYIKTQLSPVQKPKDKITNYQAEANNWKKVQNALTKAPQKDKLAKAHTKLTEATKAVAENWQRIANANKDKKAKDFNQARESLGEKYAALKAAGEGLTEKYLVAQYEATKTYQAYRK